MRYQRRVHREQRTGGHGDIGDSHQRDLLDDRIDHLVAIAQVVVERYGAAVPQAGRLMAARSVGSILGAREPVGVLNRTMGP
jgi:hypothetical protein